MSITFSTRVCLSLPICYSCSITLFTIWEKVKSRNIYFIRIMPLRSIPRIKHFEVICQIIVDSRIESWIVKSLIVIEALVWIIEALVWIIEALILVKTLIRVETRVIESLVVVVETLVGIETSLETHEQKQMIQIKPDWYLKDKLCYKFKYRIQFQLLTVYGYDYNLSLDYHSMQKIAVVNILRSVLCQQQCLPSRSINYFLRWMPIIWSFKTFSLRLVRSKIIPSSTFAFVRQISLSQTHSIDSHLDRNFDNIIDVLFEFSPNQSLNQNSFKSTINLSVNPTIHNFLTSIMNLDLKELMDEAHELFMELCTTSKKPKEDELPEDDFQYLPQTIRKPKILQPSSLDKLPTYHRFSQEKKQLNLFKYRSIKTITCPFTMEQMNSMRSRLDKICPNYFQEWSQPENQNRKIYIQNQNIAKRRQKLEDQFKKSFQIPTNWELTVDNIILSSHGMKTLQPKGHLSGETINFSLNFLKNHILQKQVSDKIYIFSTYFMTKLMGQAFYSKCSSKQWSLNVQKNYEGVKKWTKDTNIFAKQYIIIPVNINNHWIVIIILNLPQFIQNRNHQCSILYLDSFSLLNKRVVEAIRIYLLCQLKSRLSIKDKQKMVINQKSLPCYQLLLPRQTNLYDCGIYVLLNIQNFFLNPRLLHKNFTRIKNRKFLRLFPRSLAFTQRLRLRWLFYNFKRYQGHDYNRKLALEEYICSRQQILQKIELDLDYDFVDLKEFRTFAHNHRKTDPDPENQQENLYQLMLQFCSQTNSNYFTRIK